MSYTPNDKKNPAYLHLLKQENCDEATMTARRAKIRDLKSKIADLKVFVPLSFDQWMAENKQKMDEAHERWVTAEMAGFEASKSLRNSLPTHGRYIDGMLAHYVSRVRTDEPPRWLLARISDGPNYSEAYDRYRVNSGRESLKDLRNALSFEIYKQQKAKKYIKEANEYFEIK